MQAFHGEVLLLPQDRGIGSLRDCAHVRMSFAAYTQAPARQQKEERQMFVDILFKWNSVSLQVKEWMASMEYGHPGTQWLEIQPVVVILENCLEIFG